MTTNYNIYQKLLNIQKELKAPKNLKNSFGGYYYRSCEDILEALKPLLAKYNVTLIFKNEIELKEGNNTNGRFYIKATAILINLENPTEKVEACAYAREEQEKKAMDGAQITGSATSYAQKYALNSLFLLDDSKDPDAYNNHGKTTNVAQYEKPKKITFKDDKFYISKTTDAKTFIIDQQNKEEEEKRKEEEDPLPF